MKPRKEIQWFAQEMEAKLRENDHKGHWQNERTLYLFHRMREESDELLMAMWPRQLDTLAENLTNEQAEDMIRECADVANFAMMLADIIRNKNRNT